MSKVNNIENIPDDFIDDPEFETKLKSKYIWVH